MHGAAGEVIYEVDLDVEAAIADDYRAWLQAHMREILALPGFLGATLSQPRGTGCRARSHAAERAATRCATRRRWRTTCATTPRACAPKAWRASATASERSGGCRGCWRGIEPARRLDEVALAATCHGTGSSRLKPLHTGQCCNCRHSQSARPSTPAASRLATQGLALRRRRALGEHAQVAALLRRHRCAMPASAVRVRCSGTCASKGCRAA